MNPDPNERIRRGTRVSSRFRPLLLLALAPSAAHAQANFAHEPNWLPLALALILVCVFVNALFVAAATAIELLRPSQIRAERNEARQAALQRAFDRRTTLVATSNLAVTTLRAWMILLCFLPAPLLAMWAEQAFGWKSDIWLTLLAAALLAIPVAALDLVLAQLAPRSYAAAYPAITARRLLPLVTFFSRVLAPFATVLSRLAGLLTRRFGVSASFALSPIEEELLAYAETAPERPQLEAEERRLVRSAFAFGDTVAREVMTPRVDLVTAPVEAAPQSLVDLVKQSGHSRIPVYEETEDSIVGIVHAKDLLMALASGNGQTDVRELMRQAYFVPETAPLHDLLKDMRSQRIQMAIVQDEFGGTAGALTIEDIVEELVGEIVDEYDVEEPELVRNGTGFIVGGRMNLYDLNEEIGSHLESEEFDTIGGYVFGLFGRQPKADESIVAEGYRFLVQDTDGRRIKQLYIEPLAPAETVPTEM